MASAATALMLAGGVRASEITSTWSGSTGNWTDPTQWSTNPNYPNNGTPSGTEYGVVISAPGTGPYTVTLNSNVTTSNVTVNSANATLSQTSGSLTTGLMNISAGTYNFSGGSENIQTLVNAGTVIATGGGTLSFFGGNYTGGTIAVDSNSEVMININSTNDVTPSELGNFVNNGGTLLLKADIANLGNILTFGGPTGTWILGGDIDFGVVNLPSTTVLDSTDFDGVTLASNLTESVAFATIGINNINVVGHQTINLTGNCAGLVVVAQTNTSKTLSNLTVNLGGSTVNPLGGFLFLGSLGNALTLDTTTAVNGWGGIGAAGSGGGVNPLVVNQGIVTANIGGETLGISPTALTNTGMLQAIKGGILSIAPAGSTTWTNNGTLAVDSTSTINVDQSIVFADGSAFDAILGSNGASGILSITGSLDLSHDEFLNLSLAPGAVFTAPYEIASYTGALTGEFAQVTPGFVVDYSQPGEILVTAVPEPGACGLVIGGGLLALGRRRRRFVFIFHPSIGPNERSARSIRQAA